MFTNFSSHAKKRIRQRTNLSRTDIALKIDEKITVNIGDAPGLNKEHLLFYDGENFLVAIRNKLSGKIITVLPSDYHKSLAWDISEKQFNKAKLNYETDEIQKANALKSIQNEKPCNNIADSSENSSKNDANLKPSTFIVGCTYRGNNGLYFTTNLFKTLSSPYNDDVNLFMKDELIIPSIEKAISDKNISIDNIYSITFKLGRSGVPVFIVINEIVNCNYVD